MALFMDVHNIEGGVSAADVAGAHEADLATQGAHGVNYLRYWVDEEAGKIFCLVEAPDAEAPMRIAGICQAVSTPIPPQPRRVMSASGMMTLRR